MRKVIEGCKLLSGMQFSCVPETELAQAVLLSRGRRHTVLYWNEKLLHYWFSPFFLSKGASARYETISLLLCWCPLAMLIVDGVFFSQKRREMLYMCVCTFSLDGDFMPWEKTFFHHVIFKSRLSLSLPVPLNSFSKLQQQQSYSLFNYCHIAFSPKSTCKILEAYSLWCDFYSRRRVGTSTAAAYLQCVSCGPKFLICTLLLAGKLLE